MRRYRSKLSGPLLDRFDLVVDVPPVDLASLGAGSGGEGSSSVRERVVAARMRQRDRLSGTAATCNARMGPADLHAHARVDGKSRRLLLSAADCMGLSARGFDRVRRVARTIADLEGEREIRDRHVAEALQYRNPSA